MAKILPPSIRFAKIFSSGHSINESSRLLWTSNVLSKETRKTFTTVDVAEVDKHSKQMEDWWNPQGSMKGLHAMNAIRVPFIRDGLVQEPYHERSIKPLLSKKILDVGCGGGILSEPLSRLGAEVTGIDASSDLIELAIRHSSSDTTLSTPPNYCHTTIEDHAEKFENHYDGVVASEIIEHVTEKELFVKSCLRVLKPNGRIFFTTPNRTKIARLTSIYLAENVFNILPRGTHDYHKLTTPTELSFLLERNNCHVEIIYGCFYSVLSNRWYFINSQVWQFALQAIKLK